MKNTPPDLPEELTSEFSRTNDIVYGFMQWIHFCMMDTARDSSFNQNHMLSFLHQDILETLMSVPINIAQGIHNPAIRESRYLLELCIKLTYVQSTSYSSTIESKLTQFNRQLADTSISLKNRITLSYFTDNLKADFLEEVGRLYGETSSYVHLTPKAIEYRQNRLSSGRIMGKESPEDLKNVNDLLERMYAVAISFLSHSMPQYVIGDWHVNKSGELIKWHYIHSKYVAAIDENFDYKHERQEILDDVKQQRDAGINF